MTSHYFGLFSAVYLLLLGGVACLYPGGAIARMMSRYQSGGAYKRKLEALTRTRSLFKITGNDRGGLEEGNLQARWGDARKERRTSC